MFTHRDQNSETWEKHKQKNLRTVATRKKSSRWHVSSGMSSNWERWKKLNLQNKNWKKKICNLIVCCSGVHLDHNNMEPPQRTGGTNINILCIDKLYDGPHQNLERRKTLKRWIILFRLSSQCLRNVAVLGTPGSSFKAYRKRPIGENVKIICFSKCVIFWFSFALII